MVLITSVKTGSMRGGTRLKWMRFLEEYFEMISVNPWEKDKYMWKWLMETNRNLKTIRTWVIYEVRRVKIAKNKCGVEARVFSKWMS